MLDTQSGCVMVNVGLAGGISAGFTIAVTGTLRQEVTGSLWVIE